MAACPWPEARDHKLEHRDVVVRVDDMHHRVDGNPEIAGAAINDDPLAFLGDWLNHHVPIQDVADRRHAESNPGSPRGGPVVHGDRGVVEPPIRLPAARNRRQADPPPAIS